MTVPVCQRPSGRSGPGGRWRGAAWLPGILLGLGGLACSAHGAENHPATGVPTISGVLEVGRAIHVDTSAIADEDGLTAVTASGAWRAQWFYVNADGTERSFVHRTILGVVGAFYVRNTELGQRLQARVLFKDDAGNFEHRSTDVSDAVAESSIPLISIPSTGRDVGEGGYVLVSLRRSGDRSAALTIGIVVEETAPVLDGTPPTSATIEAGKAGVTVTLPTRDDAVDGPSARVTVRVVPGAGYGPAWSESASVRVWDDDHAALTVSTDTLHVKEGETAHYSVALGAVPRSTTTVRPIPGEKVEVNPATLGFTTQNWNVARTVTVLASEDGDAAAESFQIRHAVSDADTEAGGLEASTDPLTVTVHVADNDDLDLPRLQMTATPAVIDEGGSSTLTVAIANGATHPVDLAIELTAAGTAHADDYTLSPATLTLSEGDSSATASLTAIEDGIAETQETLTVTARVAGEPLASTAVTIRGSKVERSNDASLRALALSGIDIGAFAPGTTSYRADVDNAVSSTAVTATPNAAGAAVVIADADGSTAGTARTVALAAGANTITVAVTAADGAAARTYTVAVTRAALPDGPASARHHVPFLPSAWDTRRQGFVRIVNRSNRAGAVRVDAVDDDGVRHGPATLAVAANAAAHFNAVDLESGNAAKGLEGGTGAGRGDWRLALSSDLDITVLAYVRTADGFLAALHDTAPVGDDGRHRVAIFNPGSNAEQESLLRIVNSGDEAAEVSIAGVDDAGLSPGAAVRATVPAGASRTYPAAALESGGGELRGRLGDGAGKWRLVVESAQPVAVMSLLSSPGGHLANLSSMPERDGVGRGAVPLFPSAADAAGRQGFVRVVNRSAGAGEVSVKAFDDTVWDYDPLTLSVGAGRTAHFNSHDLESGDPDAVLAGSTGPGTGHWRLELAAGPDIGVLSYVRTPGGYLASMHDVVPGVGNRYEVLFFNPGRNTVQASVLRLVNAGDAAARATITAIDDGGDSPAQPVTTSIPARGVRSFTAAALESGAPGLQGALGTGVGKWRLIVASDQPLTVMSLLESPSGHLTNLSSIPRAAR